MKRWGLPLAAWVMTPAGFVMLVIGAVEAEQHVRGYGWLLGVGTLFFAIGVLSAVAAAWWRKHH